MAPTERIYSLRREATDFYRAVHPLLGVLASAERAAAPVLQPYLRDVQDHLLLVNEEVAAQRDLLGTVLEVDMAVISVEQTKVSIRQNAIIEQLTILATAFLPLTFVTGFFGQNFEWLIGRIHGLGAFLIYGIGGLAVPLVLLFLWLSVRRQHTRADPTLHEGRPETARAGREVLHAIPANVQPKRVAEVRRCSTPAAVLMRPAVGKLAVFPARRGLSRARQRPACATAQARPCRVC